MTLRWVRPSRELVTYSAGPGCCGCWKLVGQLLLFPFGLFIGSVTLQWGGAAGLVVLQDTLNPYTVHGNVVVGRRTRS